MKITAKLKNARYHESATGDCFSGEIYGDTRKRWPDGTFVRTSVVKSVDGNIVTTRNSVYECEFAPLIA